MKEEGMRIAYDYDKPEYGWWRIRFRYECVWEDWEKELNIPYVEVEVPVRYFSTSMKARPKITDNGSATDDPDHEGNLVLTSEPRVSRFYLPPCRDALEETIKGLKKLMELHEVQALKALKMGPIQGGGQIPMSEEARRQIAPIIAEMKMKGEDKTRGEDDED